MEHKEISMTGGQIKSATKRIVEARNDAQFKDGHTIDEVMVATMYLIGAGLKRRGVILRLDAPLVMALPPLVAGYKDQAKLMGEH